MDVWAFTLWLSQDFPVWLVLLLLLVSHVRNRVSVSWFGMQKLGKRKSYFNSCAIIHSSVLEIRILRLFINLTNTVMSAENGSTLICSLDKEYNENEKWHKLNSDHLTVRKQYILASCVTAALPLCFSPFLLANESNLDRENLCHSRTPS